MAKGKGCGDQVTDLKGQVATEFFIYSGVFLLLVIAVASIVYLYQSSELSATEYLVAKENGQSFADAINLAVRGGNNFTYVLNFQPVILGSPYVIDFNSTQSDGYLLMTWFGPTGNFTYPYSVSKYIYSFTICGGSQTQNILVSNMGQSSIVLFNDGQSVHIKQEGCS